MSTESLVFLLIILTIVFIIPIEVLSQITFEHPYDCFEINKSYNVQQVTDGGYVAAGLIGSYNAGGYDVCLIKTNEMGFLTSVENAVIYLPPQKYELHANYLNPFNPAKTICYEPSQRSNVSFCMI